jgi:hypothetical protein
MVLQPAGRPHSNGFAEATVFEHFATQAVLADTYVLRPNMIRWGLIHALVLANRIPGTFGQNGTAVGLPSYFNQTQRSTD